MKLFKRKKWYVKERSNVIQYDPFGYPLRLVIDSGNNQVWVDTHKEAGDVVLKWTHLRD